MLLSFSFEVLSGRLEFFISGGEDGGVACGDAVCWGDVAESGVEAHVVVMVDEAAADAFGVLKGSRVIGVLGWMASSLRVWWKRSRLPLL